MFAVDSHSFYKFVLNPEAVFSRLVAVANSCIKLLSRQSCLSCAFKMLLYWQLSNSNSGVLKHCPEHCVEPKTER